VSPQQRSRLSVSLPLFPSASLGCRVGAGEELLGVRGFEGGNLKLSILAVSLWVRPDGLAVRTLYEMVCTEWPRVMRRI